MASENPRAHGARRGALSVPFPPNIPPLDHFVWRLILNNVCTLHEFDSHWTLADMLDGIEVLDWKQAIEADQAREIEEKTKWRR